MVTAFRTIWFSSYRCFNGVLNNPKADRRTTAGTFHVVEGGLAIPGDKRAVPKSSLSICFARRCNPRRDLMTLPYMSQSNQPSAHLGVAIASTIGLPRGAGVLRGEVVGVSFFRSGVVGQQSGFCGIDFWQCRRSADSSQ